MADDQFHHSDPLPKNLPDYGRELFDRFGKAADGFASDAIISAAINLLVQVMRENYGKRDEVERRIDELAAKWKELTFRFYDPVTNRRRSNIPFTQRVTPPTLIIKDLLRP